MARCNAGSSQFSRANEAPTADRFTGKELPVRGILGLVVSRRLFSTPTLTGNIILAQSHLFDLGRVRRVHELGAVIVYVKHRQPNIHRRLKNAGRLSVRRTIDRQKEREIDRQTDHKHRRQTDGQNGRQTDSLQTTEDRQTDKRTANRQTDRQTDGQQTDG